MTDKLRTTFKNQFEITKSVLDINAKQLQLTAAGKNILVHLTHFLGPVNEFGNGSIT